MSRLPSDPIAAGMDGRLWGNEAGRLDALLPSPCIQNHAAFLSLGKDGLACLWFGGTLEGKSDISIYRSTLGPAGWSATNRISDDSKRSEQNPVEFHVPDGRQLVLHTAQLGGQQDACTVRMRELGGEPRDLPLPKGTFIRGPVHVRPDGAWLLPL
ncbi:MAG: exo-alpha-sialidase, partial [Hyphomicrobiales bacterium]|nr:exo-alpha-sialidase [Hyphomicrobiales bacterium]